MRERAVILVAVECDGAVDVHLPPGLGGYATLCGMDGTDQAIGMAPATLPPRARVTCAACIAIWKAARSVPPRYVAPAARPSAPKVGP